MDALIETIAQYPAIKRDDSSKLFYKKYPFRVLFDFTEYNIANHGRFTRTFPSVYGDRILEFISIPELICEVAPTCPYKARSQNGQTNFYFVDPLDAAAFIQTQAGFIISVTMPESAQALAAINGDVRIEIRDTLYWNKYRWAAVCKALSEDQLDEIRDWTDSYKDQFTSGDDRIMMSYSSSSPRIFFNEEDDLFMFKFAFFNRISRLEKVLLKKEIADESRFAQGAC
ncbi:MAG: hypothetical protein EOO77_14225 [Oxalobacteraceae bacterium]|nr:MAG: hypothetical protein EOO77_14225 [Oxalobacteraceae bacterium]